jgi:serine/threonine protein kinase
MEDVPSEPRSDRYEIVRRIGEGGMGVVYEALDRERDVRVALKTVRRANPSALARFKREFRALADVVHPNLVALYELVADDDNLFFSMELVEGEHFHRWVRARTNNPDDTQREPSFSASDSMTHPTIRVGPGRIDKDPGTLDVLRLRAAARQLAEGLSAIHGAGMLHRDLKPANVIVTPDRRVVILDFGLATDLTEESLHAAEERPLEGTVGFMSPEQGARQALTPASDWYSVGVMLFLALTGRLPFVGGRDDVLMDKQRFEPPPPQELARDLPPDLCALCSELLRTQPERRPSGADVLRRLGSELVGAPTTTSIGSSHISGANLVGRAPELGVLRDSLSATSDGAAAMVLISGTSGVGKSRLVRGFVGDLGPNALVLHGRCYEHEMVPFKAVDSLIDALARHLTTLPPIAVEGLMPRDALALARVFPVLRQVEAFTARRRRATASADPQELRRRVFAALRELLTRLADRQPLVLAIDDLQWGDVDSAALLAALLRPPDPPPMLVLGTHRSEDAPGSAFLSTFERYLADLGIQTRRLLVAELSLLHARELAAVHLAGQPHAEEHAEWIATESGGNPLFVEELARHMAAAGSKQEDWASLEDALRTRLGRLPDDAGRLLGMIAVAGHPIAREVAMRAAGVTDPSVLSLLRAGSFVRTRLVSGERFVECYHDRIRETATAMLEVEQKPRFHERLARAFETTKQPDPEELSRGKARHPDAGVRPCRDLASDRPRSRPGQLHTARGTGGGARERRPRCGRCRRVPRGRRQIDEGSRDSRPPLPCQLAASGERPYRSRVGGAGGGTRRAEAQLPIHAEERARIRGMGAAAAPAPGYAVP